MAGDDLDELIRKHGPPYRVQTGVVYDEDGWQAIAKWYFKDGSVMQQYLTPAANQAEAEQQAAQWSKAIRSVWGG
jgi:hypothetical protein